jgi:N utilization substance protein A
MFDLKVIHSVLQQLEDERGIPKAKMLEAIELALATAYKKEYGKKGQIIRATFDNDSGKVEFYQVKIVVDETKVIMEDEVDEQDLKNIAEENIRVRFNPEHHILLADAKKIKKDAKVDDEIVFPLEEKGDYGRIAAQTAKQVIIQKIREAEKVSVLNEYGQKEGEIVSGIVQRVERGSIFVDMGRATGMISYEEQIPGEHYKQGERVRAYLYAVEESPKGIMLKLSRAHPKFLSKLFEIEAPEIAQGVVEIKAVAREAGARSKIAVSSADQHIDPIGSLVGQRGVRVSTVMSELRGEKIDIIQWNENISQFIEESLSPAKVLSIELKDTEKRAVVQVSEDQQSLAIGKGGQNVRLAAKLTGWKIDIQSTPIASADADLDKESE